MKGIRESTGPLRPIYFGLVVLLVNNFVSAGVEEKYHKFSLRLSGEARIMVIGDINTGLRTFNDNPRFEYIRKNNPDWGRLEGNISTLNNIFACWVAELRFDLSRRVGLGIATAGGLHRQNESTLTHYLISDVTWPYEFYYKPEIWASSPVILTFYLNLGAGSRLSSYLSGGLGYYRGGLKEQFNFTMVNGYSGEVGWTRRYWETQSKTALGFHLGWGMELLLARNLALTAEVQWRYTRISNFRAIQQYETGYPSYEETTGWLYYFTKENLFIGSRHADLTVWEVPPYASVEFIMDVRKARLDLSGLSLLVGMKIRLF
jgi:hypothetical protein